MTIIEVYDFDPVNNSYKSAGRTGLLKVCQALIICISKSDQFINNSDIIQFNSESFSELNGFLPYHRKGQRSYKHKQYMRLQMMKKVVMKIHIL